MASAGPLCKSAPRYRQITMPAPQHSVFAGRMPFLPPNQERQSTEGNTTTTEYYTHTFNGPLSGTTRVSRYQKGKTNLDFTEARDSEWQWHQLDHMQVCTSLQTDNHTSTPPLSFYRPDALPATQPTASKHWSYWILLKLINLKKLWKQDQVENHESSNTDNIHTFHTTQLVVSTYANEQ